MVNLDKISTAFKCIAWNYFFQGEKKKKSWDLYSFIWIYYILWNTDIQRQVLLIVKNLDLKEIKN